jgi:hypothetical protein
MAMAVQKLYPQAKVTIGPWIENGFYYDFDMEPLTDKDLKRIKKEMVSRDNSFESLYLELMYLFVCFTNSALYCIFSQGTQLYIYLFLMSLGSNY